jgi:putative phosphoribosyl transferase
MRLCRDRTNAGRQLAAKLRHYRDDARVIALALPRGGVPVASAVARELSAPLDVFIVRKLGVPGHDEYALHADERRGSPRAARCDLMHAMYAM